ncbi:MAG: nitroreductase family protein [Firmicutes bacterium]|nr:nitroreductase family protein [Bacillota bacterium]
MEFKDIIMNRRSIRSYEDTPISDEDLKEILEAGTYAPSAVDLQPWYFVAVKSPEEMKKVYEVMGQVSDDCAPALRERFASFPQVAEESIKFIRMLGGAPVVILAFLNKPGLTKTDAPMVESVSAALENILLAATAKGIGSCWLTAPLQDSSNDSGKCWLTPAEEGSNSKALREAFAPDKGELVAIVTLGYPKMTPKAPKRKEGRYVII